MLANRPNNAEFDRAVAGGARREILDYAVSLRYDNVSREEGRKLLTVTCNFRKHRTTAYVREHIEMERRILAAL